MASFEYRGLNKEGKNVKGLVDAENIKAAKQKLKRDGVYVVDIKDRKAQAAKNKAKGISFGSGVNVQELALMTRQLATLVKAQIPLVDSLSAVVEQVENENLKSALSDVKQMVNEGSSLYKAPSKHPKIFSNIYVSLCEAGETSGTLDIILLRLAEFTEKQNELRNRVRSAMMYPVIIGFFSSIVLVVIFVTVIPQISEVFSSMEKALPWYTEVLIAISGFMVNYWYILISVLAFVTFSFMRWKSTESGRLSWDGLKMRIPVVGKLIRMIAVSRFAKTLSTLLQGGVPMLTAFDIVKNVVDNKVFEKIIADARDNVSEGESIAGPLRKSGEFPPIVIHMISIGEKTGELESLLTQVSESYDFQVNNTVAGLTSILEPVMLIFMGGVVGFIVFAILVPILEMQNIA
ncbi:MAG: type II secretion system inner membrane protein GspF [Oligoflexia bacterium]|nr:type II secretion system inner membrane protein GspF [Oligoflexia bacterium]